MNILKQIFKTEKRKLESKITPETFDIISDWFSESKIEISDFENNFFNPLIEHLKTIENENKSFEYNYEVAYVNSFTKFSIIYLAYHYPDPQLFNRLFELTIEYPSYRFFSDVTLWHSPSRLLGQNKEIFRTLNIGSQIAKFYYAIHIKKDSTIGALPGDFDKLKFNEDEFYFNQIFDYVNRQDFIEKPYLLFILFKSTDSRRHYEIDGNGNRTEKGIEIIKITKYDSKINIAFEESIEEYNNKYNNKLNKEMFLYLSEFIRYQPKDKKTKITLDNFEEAQILISKTKNNTIALLDHIIYFISYIELNDQDKYWQVLLAEACKNTICEKHWVEDKIDFLLSKNTYPNYFSKTEIKNSELIYKYIITPLIKNITNQLAYNDTVVQKYELLIFKKMQITPFIEGVDILRSIANNINNSENRIFTLNKLGSFYYEYPLLDNSYISYDPKDKSYTTIKKFINDLKCLIPIALKKINKPNYYGEGDLLIINHNGKDLNISSYNFVEDINQLLESVDSAYRLVAIPITVSQYNWHNNETIVFSLAFMNKKEYHYFSNNYITEENIEKWHPKVHDLQWFKIRMQKSTILHPTFSSYTDIPFNDYKQTQQTTQKEAQNDNIFLFNISWQWFKDKYIDELSSKEEWYDIMNIICQCPKGKKPSQSWIINLRKEIEKLGTEKYFKELQVLLSLSIKEESWFFDIYSSALKGLIWSCAHIDPNDLSISILKTIAEHSYAKIPGIGARSTTTGNLALEALIFTQKEEAFGILNIMRNKTKYNKFIVALEKSIDKFKENSAIPEELLADRSIPSFGFTNGIKKIDLLEYKVVLSFKNKKLVKHYETKDNSVLKQLPASVANENAKEVKEINEEIKQINSIYSDLGKRIRTYWLYDRNWDFHDWNKYIKNHDLIYPHIEGLIWTNETKNKDFIVLNKQLLGENNEIVEPEDNDKIYLWHPVKNNEENINKWQNYIWDNKITQPQRQSFRENYPFSSTEIELLETPRFAHHFLEVKRLMAIANGAGWIFTYVHEGYNWPRIFIKNLNLSVHLNCDYDRFSFAIPTKNMYFTNDNSTKINDYTSKHSYEKIKLSKVPLVTLSEICRDIDLFISTTSIANDVELSENRQEYESYRTEYHSRMFSENANSKIRKQIIEKLSPVLNLQIEKFEGNFVIVNGQNDSYKINLNSGFAQSNKTQKHINLIPNTSKIKSDKKLRLPIEDDETLYIILAKIIHLQIM